MTSLDQLATADLGTCVSGSPSSFAARRRLRRLAVHALAIAGAISCAACSKDEEGSSKSTSSSPSATAQKAEPPEAKPTVPAAVTNPPSGEASSAGAHLPADCDVVTLVNFKELDKQPTLAKHVREHMKSGMKGKRGEKINEALSRAAIHLDRDVETTATCNTLQAKSAFVMVLSGKLRPGVLVAALEQRSDLEGTLQTVGNTPVLELKGGATWSQARDGSVVVGSNSMQVARALKRSDALARYDLSGDEPLAFAIAPSGQKALEWIGQNAPASGKAIVLTIAPSSKAENDPLSIVGSVSSAGPGSAPQGAAKELLTRAFADLAAGMPSKSSARQALETPEIASSTDRTTATARVPSSELSRLLEGVHMTLSPARTQFRRRMDPAANVAP